MARKEPPDVSVLANVITHRELIESLVLRDIKTRYKQSVLGIAWAVLNPLIMSLIQTLVGFYFLKQRTDIPFPVFAYTGTLFWNLFSTGTSAATDSLVSHLNLITKIYFPREVFPISAVLGKLADFVFGLTGLIPLLLICRVTLAPAALMILPLLAILVLFTTGVGMIFSCANLFYRDVRHLVGLVLAFWFYLVPILYPLSQVPARFRSFYLLNPVAVIMDTARQFAFPQIGGDIPWAFLGSASVISLAVFLLGYAVFKRNEPQFAESI